MAPNDTSNNSGQTYGGDSDRKGSTQRPPDSTSTGDNANNLPPATAPSESDVNSGANAGEGTDPNSDTDPGPVPEDEQ